jgi:probable rRNA maturation factor
MHRIIIQRATRETTPTAAQLRLWAKQTLQHRAPAAECTIRLVGETEMTTLNTTYRHKIGPTNVLSFRFDMPTDTAGEFPLLGDIVICAKVVNREALEQNKTATEHWAHMVVHGILHLLGHDHVIEAEATAMEAEEIVILKSLGFENPYQVKEKGTPHE